MKIKNKTIIPWIFAILVTTLVFIIMPMVNAEIQSLPTGKINQEMSLTQTVTNSTYCNLSKITYPNNSILNLNRLMTKSTNDYNYSFTPNSLGEYSYITCCNPDGTDTCVGITFIVTNTGYETTTSKSIIILVGLAIMFLIGILLFLFGLYNLVPIVKIFTIGLAILIIAYSVGYGLNTMNNSIGEFTNLIDSFNSLYILLTILLAVGGMGLILFLISFVLKSWNKTRGFED
jgi:hypothetical protein